MSLHNPISHLRAYYVQKVLPAVYDDSLSYYEILCKVQETLNEVVSTTNEQSVVVLEMQQAINDFIHGGYTDTFEEYLDEWFEENSDAFVQRLIDEGIIPEIEDIQSDLETVHGNIADLAASDTSIRNDMEAADTSIRNDMVAADTELTTKKVPYPLVGATPSYGTSGQVLATNADGTTDWQDPVIPSDAQAEQVITQWLNAHPEATTTVQDGAISTAKLANGAVTTDKLADGSVTDVKLAQSGGILDVVTQLNNTVFDLVDGGDIKLKLVRGYYINEADGMLVANVNTQTIFFDFPNNATLFIHNFNRRNMVNKIVAYDSEGSHTLDDLDILLTNISVVVKRNSNYVLSLAISSWASGYSVGGTVVTGDPYITQIAEEKLEANAHVQLEKNYPFIRNIYNAHYETAHVICSDEGAFINNNSLKCYGYIPVNPDDVINISVDTVNNYNAFSIFACFYDDSFSFVSSIRYANRITVPQTAKYMVANFFNSDVNNITIKHISAVAEDVKIDERSLPAISSSDYRAYPIYTNIENNVCEMTYKYDESYDMTVQMQKQGGLDENNMPVGGNQLFDFCRWFKTENTGSIITNNPDTTLEGKTASDYYVNGTDFFGPYRVRAVNNADGDKATNNDFTGGNHQYNNSGSGSTATARTANIVFKVDGKPTTSYSGYCRSVEIEWDNFIQGNNTKKADGSGREILKEHYTVRFDGYKFHVENIITALESIYIYTYYGEQMKNQYSHVNAYNILFLGSKTTKRAINRPNSGLYFSGDKYCRDIVNRNTQSSNKFYKNTFEMGMESVGLGDFDYAKTEQSSCLASTGKIYYNLVNAFDSSNNTIDMGNVLNLNENDIIYYRGWYRFYKQE